MKIKTHHCLLLLFFCLFNCKENHKRDSQEINRFSQLLDRKQLSKPAIMVHRGRLNDSWPENAIASFDEINQLSEGLIIELDVRKTKDGTYVLLHDETLDRTTIGSGLLSEKTFDEVSQLQLISNSGDTTNYKIPKFEEALKWSRSKNILAIDAKLGCEVKDITSLINEMDIADNCFVICYSIEDAKHYNELNPNLVLALGFNSWEELANIKKSGLPLKNLLALTPTSLQKEKFYDEIRKLGIDIAYGTYKTIDYKDFETVKNIYKQYFQKFDIITTDRAKSVYLLSTEKE